jgi:hypothetical protein
VEVSTGHLMEAVIGTSYMIAIAGLSGLIQ